MRVTISGAGVGGLALARGLLDAGHEVTVLEEAPRRRSGGAALTLWPNGTDVLNRLGVPIDDLGRRIDVLEATTGRGASLSRVDVAAISDRLGAPTRTVLRDELIERLSAGLPDGTIRFSASVADAEVDVAGVTLTTTSGERYFSDVAVGADGNRSRLRVVPSTPTEWISWQGVTRVPATISDSHETRMMIDRSGAVGLMPCGDGRLLWWFDVDHAQTSWGPDAPAPEVVERLRDQFADYGDPVPTILEALTPGMAEPYPHHTHRVPPVWGRGTLTLLGDAAHTMPPSMGQGANQTLQDVHALLEALRRAAPTGGPALEAALRGYERDRARRIRPIAAMAGRETSISYRPPVLTRLLPDRVAQSLQEKLIRRSSASLS
ncbi:FAD-dependent oxidoreductase [Ruania alba]|uniref:FAD-dependent urate hydroxylase n=1 Tax=Ruania alba TaxID=648782 RepID=A0A1H5L7K9_9MICO|nr:NAD(P)/FAD-dependent oxidoreductase [Ruania alba]SEE73066.1 FAD-dependent urate hydroxylase [Ruania alba]